MRNNPSRLPRHQNRSSLLEQLEQRLLFDAVPDMPPVGADGALDQSGPATAEGGIDQVGVNPAIDLAQQTDPAVPNEIVFVDKRAEGYELLLAELVTTYQADVVFLNRTSDGLDQIASILAARMDVDTIHLIAPVNDGSLILGQTVLNGETAQSEYLSQLQGIASSLSEDGTLFLHADALTGEQGTSLVGVLEQITRANVLLPIEITAESDSPNSLAVSNSLINQVDQNLPITRDLTRREIVFISTDVYDYQYLSLNLDPALQVVLIDDATDGLEQIANVLRGESNISAIHLISHGSAGELIMGSTVVDTASLSSDYADELSVIRAALTDDGDFLVYGCDTASGDVGQAFIKALALGTGADVAASNDSTGAAALGGNWILETHVGNVDALAIAVTDYQGLLATAVVATDTLGTATPSASSYSTGAGWLGDWTETDTGAAGGATAGFVRIVGNAASDNEIRFTGSGATRPVQTLQRTVNLTGYSDATINLATRHTPSVSALDSYGVEVSYDGGGTWVTLATYSGGSGASADTVRTLNITGGNASTVIRLFSRVASGVSVVYFDDVAVTGNTPVNAVPVAVDDTLTAAEDDTFPGVVFDPRGNDSDSDGNPLSITAINGQPANPGDWIFVNDPNGFFAAAIELMADGTLTYHAFNNYSGPLSFTYTIADGQGGESAATVNVTVNPINDAPYAVDDHLYTNENTQLTGNVLANNSGFGMDFDVEGDALSVTQFTVNGTTYATGTAVILPQGKLTINTDGSFTFDPATDYNGLLPNIYYTLSDSNGGTETGALLIGVRGDNHSPNAVDDFGIITGTQTMTITDPATMLYYNTPTGLLIGLDPISGTQTVLASGLPTYVDIARLPDGSFYGSASDGSLCLITLDGSGGFTETNLGFPIDTATGQPSYMAICLTVSPDGRLLTSSGDVIYSVDPATMMMEQIGAIGGGSACGDLLVHDGYLYITTYQGLIRTPYDNISLETSAVVTPILYNSAYGLAVIDETHLAMFGDAGGASVSVVDLITGEVTPNPWWPMLAAGYGADHLQATHVYTYGGVLLNDSDPDGDPLTVMTFEQAGTAVMAGGSITSPYGTLTLQPNGTYTYVQDTSSPAYIALNGGQIANDIFTYTIVDSHGMFDTATLTIQVTGNNVAPMVDLDSAVLAGGSVDVLASTVGWTLPFGASINNDQLDMLGATATFCGITTWDQLATLPMHVQGSAYSFDVFAGGTVMPDGSVVGGTVLASWDSLSNTLTYADGFTQTLTWSELDAGVNLNIPVPTGLSAVGDLHIRQVPNEGDVIGLVFAQIMVASPNDRDFATTYVENGPGVSIADADAGTFDIDNPNLASATIVLTNAQAGDVLAAGMLPGGISSSINLSVPGQITVVLSGTASQADYADAIKAVTFSSTSENPPTIDRVIHVTVNDGSLDSNTATTIVHVTLVNDAPVANNDGFITFENTGTAIQVLINDTDAEGNPLTVTRINGQPISVGSWVGVDHGSVQLRADGTLWFEPHSNYSGPIEFTYDVTDAQVTMGSLTPLDWSSLDGFVTDGNAPYFDPNAGPFQATGSMVIAGQTVNYTLTGFFYDDSSAPDFGSTPEALYFPEMGSQPIAYTLTFDRPVYGLQLGLSSLGYTNQTTSTWDFGDNPFTVLSTYADPGFTTSVTGNTITSMEGGGQLRFNEPLTQLNWTISGVGPDLVYTIGRFMADGVANSSAPGSTTTGTVTGTVIPADYRPDITLDGTPLQHNINFGQWNHTGDTNEAQDVNSTYLSATGTETAHGNLSLTVTGTTQWVDGVTSATLSDAISNDDYIEYSFTVADPLPPDQALQLSGLHIYDTGIMNSFDRTVVLSDDPTFANSRAIIPVNSGGLGNQGVNLGFSTPIELLSGQTYYMRVYLYNAADPGASVGFDDFTPFFNVTEVNDSGAFNAGDPPVAIDPSVVSSVHDWNENDITTLTVVAAGVRDGDNEVVRIGEADFALGSNSIQTVTFGATSFSIAYDATSETFTVTNLAGASAAMPAVDLQTLVNGMTYQDTLANPSPGGRSFTFTVTDAAGQTSSATRSAIVVGEPTNTVDDIMTGTEDTQTNIDVLANDSNADGFNVVVTHVNGQAISLGGTVAITNGSVTLNADGTLTFTPMKDFNGLATFEYTITDTSTAPDADTGTVTIHVAPVADIVDDTATTLEDVPVVVNVLANDNFEAPISALPSQLINVAGGFLMPDFGFIDMRTYITSGGETSFPVTVLSPGGYQGGIGYSMSSTGTGEIQVVRVTLSSDTENSVVGAVVTDASGNPLAGHWSQLPAGNQSYGPLATAPVSGANVNSPLVFEFILDAPTAADTVFLNVAADGFVPATYTVVSADFLGSIETPLAIVEIDGQTVQPGDTVSVENGAATLNADGTISFTPIPNFTGPTGFTYTVLSGGVTETATVTIDVMPVNDAPVNTLPAPGWTTNEDTTVLLAGLSIADIDSAAGTMTVTLSVDAGQLFVGSSPGVTISGSGTGTLTLSGTQADINALLASSSAPAYVPVAGTTASVSLTMTTSDGGNTGAGGPLVDVDTRTITIVPVNKAPTIDLNGPELSTFYDRTTLVSVLTNNSASTIVDTANAFSIDPTATPGGGSAAGGPVVTRTGAIGGQAYSYSIYDINFSNSPTGTLTPGAVGGDISSLDNIAVETPASQSGATGVGTWGVDTRTGSGLTRNALLFDFTTTPGNLGIGHFGLDLHDFESGIQPGRQPAEFRIYKAGVLINSGVVQYPSGDGDGSSKFWSYVASSPSGFFDQVVLVVGDDDSTGDGTGRAESIAADRFTFGQAFAENNSGTDYETTFTENGPGVPIGDIDTFIADIDDTYIESAVIVLTNSQPNDVLTVGALAVGISASVDTSAPGMISITFSGSATLAEYQDAIRHITFFNTSDDPSTVDRILHVTVNDGQADSNTATTTIHIVPSNDVPQVVGTIGDQISDDSQVISLDVYSYFTDADSSDTLTFSAGGTLPPGLSINFLSGVITGTLDSSASAGGPYSVTITATDPSGAHATQTFTWFVNNPVPIAQNDVFSSDADDSATVVGNVLGNDSDSDGDVLTATAQANVAGSQGGLFSIAVDGTVTFDPNGQFGDLLVGETRDTTLTYLVTDADGATTTAVVTVTVAGVNKAPQALDDYVRTPVGSAITSPVLQNDSDPNGDPLTVTILGVDNGSAVVNGDGSITFIPAIGFVGNATVRYMVEDPYGATSIATLYIEVYPSFTKDSFHDFSYGFDNLQALPGFFNQRVLSREIFTLASDPIFSGYCRPGAQITGRIVDGSGQLVGEITGNADVGGNWMIQFHGVAKLEYYRIELSYSFSDGDIYGYLGLNPSDDTYQAMQPMTQWNEEFTVGCVARHAPFNSLDELHLQNHTPLGFGTN